MMVQYRKGMMMRMISFEIIARIHCPLIPGGISILNISLQTPSSTISVSLIFFVGKNIGNGIFLKNVNKRIAKQDVFR